MEQRSLLVKMRPIERSCVDVQIAAGIRGAASGVIGGASIKLMHPRLMGQQHVKVFHLTGGLRGRCAVLSLLGAERGRTIRSLRIVIISGITK